MLFIVAKNILCTYWSFTSNSNEKFTYRRDSARCGNGHSRSLKVIRYFVSVSGIMFVSIFVSVNEYITDRNEFTAIGRYITSPAMFNAGMLAYVATGLQVLSDMHMIAPTDDMANLIAVHSSDIYEYHFSTPGNSFHSVELNYVFGAPFSGQFADEMTVNGLSLIHI